MRPSRLLFLVLFDNCDFQIGCMRSQGGEQNQEKQARWPHNNPPLHAKRDWTCGSRRSPGSASLPGAAFPRDRSGRSHLRLQLRGSAGFSPASQSLPAEVKTREPRLSENNPGFRTDESTAVADGCQMESGDRPTRWARPTLASAYSRARSSAACIFAW